MLFTLNELRTFKPVAPFRVVVNRLECGITGSVLEEERVPSVDLD